jgi:hypothetical protein
MIDGLIKSQGTKAGRRRALWGNVLVEFMRQSTEMTSGVLISKPSR